MKTAVIFREAENRAVLDHRTVVVAETAIQRLTDRALGGIAGDYAVDQFERVLAAHVVLVERRDIDQCGAVPNRVILVIMHHVVRASNEVPRPVAPVLAGAKGRRARMKRRSDRHLSLLLLSLISVVRLRLSIVDLRQEITKYAALSKSIHVPIRRNHHRR